MLREAPLGGKRGNRLIEEMKANGMRQIQLLRNDVMADGFPPGTVPVQNVQQQSDLLRSVQGNMGPLERRRARQLGI